MIVPVIGVIAAAVLLGEPLGLREVVAIALTLGGVALALRKVVTRPGPNRRNSACSAEHPHEQPRQIARISVLTICSIKSDPWIPDQDGAPKTKGTIKLRRLHHPRRAAARKGWERSTIPNACHREIREARTFRQKNANQLTGAIHNKANASGTALAPWSKSLVAAQTNDDLLTPFLDDVSLRMTVRPMGNQQSNTANPAQHEKT